MSANIQTVPYQRIYVWELPVRIYHWLNALCITVLIITGFIIGSPQAIFNSNEAYQQYWFGWIRFIHFSSAYIFLFNFFIRIYWGFVGNRYARWYRFVPFWKYQYEDLKEVLMVDIFQIKLRGRIAIGHNILAGMAYFTMFLAFVIQTVTGFGLYASMSDSFIPKIFGWVIPLMGGDATVRQWHHLFMWFFIIFIMVHLYLVFYHDYVEGRGTTSSIIGGWKFEKDDEIKRSKD